MSWDQKFMQAAELVASWSKDPSTKVGCIIADSDHNQLAEGFNGFPRGVADDERLHDRPVKYKIIVHAEANAVASAARNGHRLRGATAYVTLPPCAQCTSLLIQAGIERIVFKPGSIGRWEEDWNLAQAMMKQVGMSWQEA